MPIGAVAARVGNRNAGAQKDVSKRKKAKHEARITSAITPRSSNNPLPVRKGKNYSPDLVARAATERGIELEIRTADVLARHGFDVEHGPEIFPGTDHVKAGTEADYRIGGPRGQIFDCYAPRPETTLEGGIKNTIARKTGGQARRLIINLDDSRLTIPQIERYLKQEGQATFPSLEELIVVKGDRYKRVYP